MAVQNRKKGRRKPLFYALSQFVAWFLFILLARFRRFGARNIPKRGGCIIACSHQSYLDPVIIGFSCGRAVNYLARSTLFRNPLFAAIIRGYGAIELDRDEADTKAMRYCIKRLELGEIVLLFPEGTRTSTGEIGPLKPGVFLMSARAGVPVVPAAIEGSLKSWPRNRMFPLPAPVQVAYGKPVYAGRSARSYREMARELRVRMQELQSKIKRVC